MGILIFAGGALFGAATVLQAKDDSKDHNPWWLLYIPALIISAIGAGAFAKGLPL